jgi:predicted nucleic acid-binding protein
MILDSCFVIDLMDDGDAAVAKLDELVASGRLLSLSSLTVTEVGVGLNSPTARDRFDDVTDRMEVVPFDGSTARRAARIQRRLRGDGSQVGIVDAMIAATAAERDEPVVTRNFSEFRRIDDVRVSPY